MKPCCFCKAVGFHWECFSFLSFVYLASVEISVWLDSHRIKRGDVFTLQAPNIYPPGYCIPQVTKGQNFLLFSNEMKADSGPCERGK